MSIAVNIVNLLIQQLHGGECGVLRREAVVTEAKRLHVCWGIACRSSEGPSAKLKVLVGGFFSQE